MAVPGSLSRRRSVWALAVGAVLALAAVSVVSAQVPPDDVAPEPPVTEPPVTEPPVTEPPVPEPPEPEPPDPEIPSTDIVSIFRVGDVDADLLARVRAAARAAGAKVALADSAQAQVTAVRRGRTTVQAVPSGWVVPFALTVLPRNVIKEVMGSVVSSGVRRRHTVAMSQSSADLRGAVEGDVIDIRTSGGGARSFVITRIVPDDVVGGTELVMTDTNAARLGLSPDGRVLIYSIPSREQLDVELDERGLIDSEEFDVLQSSTERLRVRRSWRPIDPDRTLGLLETKLALGEFAFVVRSLGSVSISQDWIDEHVACDSTRPVYYCREVLHPAIPIRARCHDEIVGALRDALAEIADKGLARAIDVANANAYGGCFYPRFNRLSRDTFSGSLSRHSWGMALDTNTTTNAQGAVPRMDCRVVRIFRKWGFSWGGNYLTPDGMHIEWVGEPRHRMAYPSKYCPNKVRGQARAGAVSQRSSFFAHDGWVGDDGGH